MSAVVLFGKWILDDGGIRGKDGKPVEIVVQPLEEGTGALGTVINKEDRQCFEQRLLFQLCCAAFNEESQKEVIAKLED